MDADNVALLSQIEGLTKKLDQAESDSRRTEAFAASAFVLSIMLIREMLSTEHLSRERGVTLVKSAIRYLRRIYHIGEPPLEGDTIDTDKFIAALANIENEQGAEDLLRGLLASLTKPAP